MKKNLTIFTSLILLASLLAPQVTLANRLWSSGFELQSVTTGMEFDGQSGTGITADTSIKHSGEASLRVVRSGSAGTSYVYKQFATAADQDYYTRFYIYIATMPSSDTQIFEYTDDTATVTHAGITLKTNGTMQAYYNSSSNRQSLGSVSSALKTKSWYMIEVRCDETGSNAILDFKLNGTRFANGTVTLYAFVGNQGRVSFRIDAGVWGNTATADLYFDDIAINQNTGSYQTGFPGEGRIVHMQPNAAGDTDNTSSSPNGWQNVDEVTPDDATTVATFDAANDVLAVNTESAASAGINSYDSVTLVQIGIRERAASAASENWQLGVKSQSSGTIKSGTRTTHDDSTFKTNGDVAPTNYTMSSYVDPQAGGIWTPTLLDSMQIVASTTDATPNVNITALWALVEYIPGSVTPSPTGPLQFSRGKFTFANGKLIIN